MPNELQDLFEIAVDAMEDGRLAEALVRGEQLLSRAPGDFGFRLLRVETLTKLRRLQEALAILDDIDPEGRAQKRVYFQARAAVAEHSGNVGEAVSWFRRAADLDDRTMSGILLGACLARHGRHAEAEETFKQATTKEGDPDEAFLNLGLVLRAQGRLEEAREATKRALALTPDYVDALDLLTDLEHAIQLRGTRIPVRG